MVLFSSLEYIFTTIKTEFKILIFCIFTGPHGGMWNFQTPCTGGSNELISKFLSSMILYNHPSYFKSGEINSCRLSPLPTIDHSYNWSIHVADSNLRLRQNNRPDPNNIGECIPDASEKNCRSSSASFSAQTQVHIIYKNSRASVLIQIPRGGNLFFFFFFFFFFGG